MFYTKYCKPFNFAYEKFSRESQKPLIFANISRRGPVFAIIVVMKTCVDKAWFTNQFISGSSQNKVVANDSWFTVNSAFMYQLLDCCTILVDAYLSVKQQVFNFIGQVSFYPKFIRQTQKSVLCWTNIGSTQINIANMRVLKTSKPTCRSIIL